MRRRGQTLVATLAVLAILGILIGGVYFFGTGGIGGTAPASARPDGKGTTIPGAVKLEAQDQACRNNLSQVRGSLSIAQVSEDQFPPSIQDLGLGASVLTCPVGKEAYTYDPTTGTVACPHPGHETY